jgi:prepilin peptidase dependent protein D
MVLLLVNNEKKLNLFVKALPLQLGKCLIKSKKGFTLLEILIVIAILSILVGITVYLFYREYIPEAIKSSLKADIRNCVTNIAISRIDNSTSLAEVVSSCPRSKYTKELYLESTNPIVIKASSIIGNVTCTYNETGTLSYIVCSN